MAKYYKFSIMEINTDDDLNAKEFKEIKEKYCVCDSQSKESIFNKILEKLPLFLDMLDNQDVEWQKVKTQHDKSICY